ncbi:acyl-CoA synthetase [Rhodococcus sp. WB1]|uniref:AMP-binding protein n=1 Tax=unclassified Rhodococcus (in: high G+C Gram-positive bacteria) TaxID=192944 RepID=UPI00081AAAFA|nr:MULTISPECIES: AMP-binding protein [unclassified Rhodococcus (in: high G+C Gram-positive bacteria)]ANZ26764.1 acyl-CoA synthetase [Rhodococcus sp. WB1]USC16190.1 AMP-binding protein [Rhodococcus sp. 11-3]
MTRQLDTVPTDSDALEAALAEIRRVQEAHWPPEVPRTVEYPIEGRGLVDYLRHWASVRPHAPAIEFYGRTVGYAEYDDLSDRFAGWLLARGARAGDRVGVHLGNCPQFHVAMLGILKIGAVHVPVNPMLREHELAHELADAGVTILLTQPELLPLVEAVRPRTPVRHVAVTALGDMLAGVAPGEVPPPFPVADPAVGDWAGIVDSPRAPAVATDPDALAALNYTGGTTGMPKGCEHTQWHMVYTAAAATVGGGRRVGETTVVLNYLPMFWIAGEVFGILNPLVNGGTVVLMTRWDADAALALVERHGVTSTVGTVDNYVELLEAPGFDGSRAASLDNAMAVSFVLKLDPAIRRRWRDATGHTLREASYGMTETNTADTFTLGFQDGDVDLQSEPVFCGLPVPGTDILIVDETGVPVPIGVTGQIIVRSPSVTTGYYRNAEATADSFQGAWLCTGDVGRFDERGALHYLARNKEMIKTNGMSVFPAEVEALLRMHPDVATVAVVPKSDPDRGQVAFAFVQPVPGTAVTAEGLVAWARENMAGYKVPIVELVAALPMTATGKIRKGDLFARAEERN